MAFDSSDDLRTLLDDVERHLAWQQGSGASELLISAEQRAALAALRSEGTTARSTPPSGPAASPVARAPAPSSAREPSPSPARVSEPRGPPKPEPIHRPWMKAPPSAAPVPAPQVAKADTESGAAIEPPERRTLDEIRRELGDCRRCKLCDGRKQIVFGVGNPRAQLVFVGEGPGADEDAQGVPFVGAAGQLLTKMIEAMGFSRDEVYICNVVKCRPPGNRNPEPDEIAACEPFLKAQLGSIQPKAIVALGKFAAQTLLRDSTPITRLRGTWREYEGIPLMPTFHPAYLLRSPHEKKAAWADLKQVMQMFGRAPAAAKKEDA